MIPQSSVDRFHDTFLPKSIIIPSPDPGPRLGQGKLDCRLLRGPSPAQVDDLLEFAVLLVRPQFDMKGFLITRKITERFGGERRLDLLKERFQGIMEEGPFENLEDVAPKVQRHELRQAERDWNVVLQGIQDRPEVLAFPLLGVNREAGEL